MFVPFHVTYMRVEYFEDNMHIKRYILFNELYTTSIKSTFHAAMGAGNSNAIHANMCVVSM